MTYRQAVPLPIRYLIALALWLSLVGTDLFLRALFVFFLPFVGLVSAFGRAHTQETAQIHANLADFYTRPLMRMPSFPHRLGRSRAASCAITREP
jgi:hypothetical protein